jgi:hypothetical protein
MRRKQLKSDEILKKKGLDEASTAGARGVPAGVKM